ncbi:hypothetical protein ES702_02299 [subsurface metagenome]
MPTELEYVADQETVDRTGGEHDGEITNHHCLEVKPDQSLKSEDELRKMKEERKPLTCSECDEKFKISESEWGIIRDYGVCTKCQNINANKHQEQVEEKEFACGCNNCDYYTTEEKDSRREVIMVVDTGLCKKCREEIATKTKTTNDKIKEELKEEKAEQELEDFKEGEINWLENEFWDCWDKVKGHSKKLWNHKEEYLDEKVKWFFLAHTKDTIKGKPQLIEQVQKRIPLIRQAVKKEKDKETGEITEIQSFYFFDEKFDKRHDGFQADAFALDFWFYRIITEEGKEYYILSQKKLPNQTCTFKGMLMELDDFAEISRSMKIKSLSRLFMLRSFEPDIKILSPEQIVKFTKERNITESDWLCYLGYHKFGSINLFPFEAERFRSAFVLGGKSEGYPNHIGIVGTTGTKKTMGHIETISSKFSDEPSIIEGGDSRIKGLSPSFKEKPANIGYVAKQERMGWIDEIGKMIELLAARTHDSIQNVLGELNFLLEHKLRTVGSGNDNDVTVQATAKFMFVTNPVANRPTLNAHVGLIDPTMMSRIMWWVQDDAETEFVLGRKSIVKVVKNPPYTETSIRLNVIEIENRKIDICLGKCSGSVLGIMSRDEFLTLFDSCYDFCSKVDELQVQRLVETSTAIAREPMKSSVWKPRASHHVKLLIDGLCKHRCLFKDYDSSFVANQEDYDLAERILVRMVKSWETNLLPKEDYR